MWKVTEIQIMITDRRRVVSPWTEFDDLQLLLLWNILYYYACMHAKKKKSKKKKEIHI